MKLTHKCKKLYLFSDDFFRTFIALNNFSLHLVPFFSELKIFFLSLEYKMIFIDAHCIDRKKSGI